MKARALTDGIYSVGAIDWDRQLFDSLIPLPDGTSYNAYLVQGSAGAALIDTVEPHFADVLFSRLEDAGVHRLDYVVANHAEQDHSGSLPLVLARFPGARVLCTPKAKPMLCDLLPLAEDAIDVVEDGQEISLGDRQLRFIHFPWVHWPETMLTYEPATRTLFPCDLFGSHLATNQVMAHDTGELLQAARLYFAQIMMPFSEQIVRRMPQIDALDIDRIAPSHGPVHGDPRVILDAYRGWVGDGYANVVVLPFISMHESTRLMVDHLIDALTDRGVRVARFNLENADMGRMAMALVDAPTLVLATPTVLGGPHPNVLYAAHLANLLRPRTRYAGIIGSFGWGGKTIQVMQDALPNLKVTFHDPVLSRGTPGREVLAALDGMADAIAIAHGELGVLA